MWEEVLFQQLENSNHPMHIIQDNDEESLENWEVSERYLPLCFASIHFIKDNFHAIRNQQSLSFNFEVETDSEILEQVVYEKSSPKTTDEIIYDIKPSPAPDLQPPNAIEGQIIDEGLEAETYDLMMQEDSLPLCFEAFQFVKKNFRNISKRKVEQSVECHADTSQQYFQVYYDPIAHVLDDV